MLVVVLGAGAHDPQLSPVTYGVLRVKIAMTGGFQLEQRGYPKNAGGFFVRENPTNKVLLKYG